MESERIYEIVRVLESRGWNLDTHDSNQEEFTAFVDYENKCLNSNIPKAWHMARFVERVMYVADEGCTGEHHYSFGRGETIYHQDDGSSFLADFLVVD